MLAPDLPKRGGAAFSRTKGFESPSPPERRVSVKLAVRLQSDERFEQFDGLVEIVVSATQDQRHGGTEMSRREPVILP
jgi:hypothetical protein